MMDLIILKKRLSTFQTEGGVIRNVSDELLLDILKAWECWTGKAKDFYMGLGLCKQSMVNMIRKAKKLSRNGSTSAFKEMHLESIIGAPVSGSSPIEITWEQGKVIRFSSVDHLIDFLKKVA